jgi:Tol biopolymer transport system component
MSSNGLTLYFDAARSGGVGSYDLYRSTRPSTDDPFVEPTLLLNVNSAAADRMPVLSRDELTLYFESDRTPNAGLDIMVATRASLTAEFWAPSLVLGLNSHGRDDNGSLTNDDRTLYFSSGRSGSDDILQATITSAGAFGTPTGVYSLNTEGSESSPVISADGLTMYFSNQPLGMEFNSDVYVAHRSTLADGFGAATPIEELNSDRIDFPSWISDDECTIVLSSDRLRQNVTYDLYLAVRAR